MTILAATSGFACRFAVARDWAHSSVLDLPLSNPRPQLSFPFRHGYINIMYSGYELNTRQINTRIYRQLRTLSPFVTTLDNSVSSFLTAYRHIIGHLVPNNQPLTTDVRHVQLSTKPATAAELLHAHSTSAFVYNGVTCFGKIKQTQTNYRCAFENKIVFVDGLITMPQCTCGVELFSRNITASTSSGHQDTHPTT